MAAKQQSPRPRHIPQRLCIACRRVDAKRTLIRLVRTGEGGIVIDSTGKKAGRGAYLCAERPCWQQAIKRGAIERALKITLSDEDRLMLEAYAEQLPEAQPAEATMTEPAS